MARLPFFAFLIVGVTQVDLVRLLKANNPKFGASNVGLRASAPTYAKEAINPKTPGSADNHTVKITPTTFSQLRLNVQLSN